MSKISKRIKVIASKSKGYHTLVDIGVDHGYTILEALTIYGVKKAYAIDISEGALAQAKRTLASFENVTYILNNGLVGLNIDFDLAVISGMGSLLMIDIIKGGYELLKNKDLILEPQGNIDELRIFLINHNFKIVDEQMIYDKGKYYEILKVTPGKMQLYELDIMFGPFLRREKSETFINYYKKLLIKFKEAYSLSQNENLLKKIKGIEKVIGE